MTAKPTEPSGPIPGSPPHTHVHTRTPQDTLWVLCCWRVVEHAGPLELAGACAHVKGAVRLTTALACNSKAAAVAAVVKQQW